MSKAGSSASTGPLTWWLFHIQKGRAPTEIFVHAAHTSVWVYFYHCDQSSLLLRTFQQAHVSKSTSKFIFLLTRAYTEMEKLVWYFMSSLHMKLIWGYILYKRLLDYPESNLFMQTKNSSQNPRSIELKQQLQFFSSISCNKHFELEPLAFH